MTLRFLGARCRAVFIAFATFVTLLTVSGCATVRQDVPRVASHAIGDGDRTPTGRAFAEQAKAHSGLSGFRVMAAGRTALVARAALADAAERSLGL